MVAIVSVVVVDGAEELEAALEGLWAVAHEGETVVRREEGAQKEVLEAAGGASESSAADAVLVTTVEAAMALEAMARVAAVKREVVSVVEEAMAQEETVMVAAVAEMVGEMVAEAEQPVAEMVAKEEAVEAVVVAMAAVAVLVVAWAGVKVEAKRATAAEAGMAPAMVFQAQAPPCATAVRAGLEHSSRSDGREGGW